MNPKQTLFHRLRPNIPSKLRALDFDFLHRRIRRHSNNLTKIIRAKICPISPGMGTIV